MEGWEIDRALVTYHKKIGSGSFGTVYLGSYFGKYINRSSSIIFNLIPSILFILSNDHFAKCCSHHYVLN